METNTKMIKEDVIVSKVIGDSNQNPNVLMIFGFTGKAGEEGHIRLYLTPQLDDYVDISVDNIYNTMEVPPPLSYFGGSLLWIDRDCDVIHRDVDNTVFKAPFAEGRKKNGKNPGTYADVIMNMYSSPLEEKTQSDTHSTGYWDQAAATAQNTMPLDFSNNPFAKIFTNMPNLYGQAVPGQQTPPATTMQTGFPGQPAAQIPGIPVQGFTLHSPNVSPDGLVQHKGVMAPGQPVNTSMPAAMHNARPMQPQFPGMEEWPPIPDTIKQGKMTEDQQRIVNKVVN